MLDDLYCGNIYPAEQVVPHEKEYRKLHRHTGELLTELEEKLSKEQMELVNQFHTHIIDVHCMELEAQFQYGFSLGMMLMKEVYELLKHHHNSDYMTWSTNGFAGTILILDGKFSINGDRGILVPKNGRQDLDFDYMKFTLEPIFRELAKGRKGDNGEDEFTKLYPSMLNDIMVPIPVDGEGNISLSLQKEIAQKFISVQNSQKEIIEKLDALISKKISI